MADTHEWELCLWGSDDTKVYEVIIGMREWNNLTKGTDNWNLVMKLTWNKRLGTTDVKDYDV